MSGDEMNPYSSMSSPMFDDIERVRVRPLSLFRRAMDLMGDQYMLFVGITLVGMLIGVLVPLNLLMGAMLLGIFLCYREREQGRQVEFGMLFRGFDQFVDSLLAFLMITAAVLVLYVPIIVLWIVAWLLPAIQSGPSQPPPPMPLWLVFVWFFGYLAVIFVSMLFMFTFQLMADRKYKPMRAISDSATGVLRNFWGVLGFMIVSYLAMFVALIACWIPCLFMNPIVFGASYILYRDIYGPSSQTNAPPMQ